MYHKKDFSHWEPPALITIDDVQSLDAPVPVEMSGPVCSLHDSHRGHLAGAKCNGIHVTMIPGWQNFRMWGINGRVVQAMHGPCPRRIAVRPSVARMLGFTIDTVEIDFAEKSHLPSNVADDDGSADEGNEANGDDEEAGVEEEKPFQKHDPEMLLLFLEVAALLKPGVTLSKLLRCVFRLLKHGEDEALCKVLNELEESALAVTPHRLTLERTKVKLDLCILHWKQYLYRHGWECVGSVGMDASEQGHVNYLFTRFEYVHFPKDWSVTDKLNAEWSHHYCSDCLPVGCLGYGEASFPRKLELLSHQARMFSGPPAGLDVFRRNVVGIISDQAGTERQFANAGAIHDRDKSEQVVLAAEAASGMGDSSSYFFPRALGFTDPMHMFWNAFEAAVKACPEWEAYQPMLQGCLAFLGHKGRRQKWMETQNLSAEERKQLHNFKFKLIDWKWQYMAKMWNKFSTVAPTLLERLSIEEIKKPVSEGDGRVTALDPSALKGIADAMSNKPWFLACTEMYNVFSSAVNRQHEWLTGCDCHDYIWSSGCSDAQKLEMLIADIGVPVCWRRGRRASSLARGHLTRMMADVRQADSIELQRRISALRGEQRERIIHATANKKRMWNEEIGEKLKLCELFPFICTGLWPPDAGAQAVAVRMVEMWKTIVQDGKVAEQNRITLDFMVAGRHGDLGGLVQLAAATGAIEPDLALAAKEYNMLPTHAQRVEELHAKLMKMETRPGLQKKKYSKYV